jgi:triacylglycerol lipase
MTERPRPRHSAQPSRAGRARHTALTLAGFVMLWGCFAGAAQAESLFLLQGYLGGQHSWRESGATALLERAGWQHGGNLRMDGAGTVGGRLAEDGPRRYYTVSFPTEAPLSVQADFLGRYVRTAQGWHPGETLVLAGHSAGGVAARLLMVRDRPEGISTVVSIASPHLGTNTAELGALAGSTPLAWFAPLVGGDTINRARTLYHELVRERPGTFLYWLNRQAHPQARYVSIIRSDSEGTVFGDLIVPTWSQDMNNVFALRGRAERVLVPGSHALTQADGASLLRILNVNSRL